MAFPSGVTTCVVTAGSALDFIGRDGSIQIEVETVLGGNATHITWAATGQPIIPIPSSGTGGDGAVTQVVLPHVDQPGFIDGSGNATTMWSYRLTITATFKGSGGKTVGRAWYKNLQPLQGQTSIDLGDVPDGSITSPTSAPIPAVTSVNGQTGAVTVEGATDAAVAALVTDGPQTQAALNGAYAAKSWVGATPPLPLNSVTVAAEGAPAVRPFESMGGHLWGYSNTPDLYRSDDNGATWVLHTTLPSGQVQRIAETSDGGVVAVTDLAIYKSANFYDAAPTWSASKKDVNGGARFTRFGFSGDGSKFIAAEYGPGDANFADSRYAHVSLDAGETWATVWDSDTITANAPADSHVHGCCYDPWEDAFYVVEGHSVDAGIWRSEDDGATWVLHEGMRAYSAPTCVVATDDGLVCTSDDPKSGLWGVPRAGAPELRTIIRTWDWRQGYDGVIGFGQQAVRDPETGIVYAVYQSSFPDVAPIIAGGTATVGGLMWEYPNLPVTAGDELSALCLGDNGKVMVPAFINGQRQTVTAYRTNHGQSATADPGGVTGGSAVNGSSIAVGAKSTTGDAIRATAVGVKANAIQDAVAIGYSASAPTASGIAIGSGTTAAAADGVVIGKDAAAPFGQSVAIGKGAATNTGGSAVAVGWSATARTKGAALGAQAFVDGTGGVALGQGATVKAGHTNSVAVGAGSVTSTYQQVQVGARHFELGEVATEPGVGAANTGRLYLRDNGAGKSELVVQFPTGTPVVLATEV